MVAEGVKVSDIVPVIHTHYPDIRKIINTIQGSVVDNYVALLKGELSEMKEGASCETPDDEAENCSH